MVNTEMLQEKMKNHGFTIKDLAARMGLSQTGLFNKIHNKREFKGSEINSISVALKLNKSDINRIFFARGVE
jgi:transcriptional regulator with XRE-family HTH domain